MIKVIGKIDIPERTNKKPTWLCTCCGNPLRNDIPPYQVDIREDVYGSWHTEYLCESCYHTKEYWTDVVSPFQKSFIQ